MEKHYDRFKKFWLLSFDSNKEKCYHSEVAYEAAKNIFKLFGDSKVQELETKNKELKELLEGEAIFLMEEYSLWPEEELSPTAIALKKRIIELTKGE